MSENEAEGRITVTRTDEDDVGGPRHILVRIDDGPDIRLAAGQTLSRPLAPGAHRVRADNTLFRKTLEFDLAPGEHVRFGTANLEGFLTWLVWVLGTGPLYLRFERRG